MARFRWTQDDTLYRQALDEDIAIARRRMGKDGGFGDLYRERDQMRAHGYTECGVQLVEQWRIERDLLVQPSNSNAGGESMRGVADDYTALSGDIAKRLAGVPRAVKRGDVIVPVAIDIRARPLVSDEELEGRDHLAHRSATIRRNDPATISTKRQCLAMYTHAQQSDSIGLHFMTRNERALASSEWSAQLRAKVKASDDRRKYIERTRVLVDIQDDD